MYLTYDEYVGLGGTLEETDFIMAEFTARKVVDSLTASRVSRMAKVPEAVKMCLMSIIKINASYGAAAQATQPVVTSFSTDGYSESYGKQMSSAEADKAMRSVVRQLLDGERDDYGVPLLYRGLDLDYLYDKE